MPGPADTFGKGLTKRGVSSAGQSLSTLVVRLGPLKPWHVCFPRSEAGSAALCRTAVAAQLAGSASSTRACGCRAWRRRTGCTIRGEGGASGSTAPSLAVWQLSQRHLGRAARHHRKPTRKYPPANTRPQMPTLSPQGRKLGVFTQAGINPSLQESLDLSRCSQSSKGSHSNPGKEFHDECREAVARGRPSGHLTADDAG